MVVLFFTLVLFDFAVASLMMLVGGLAACFAVILTTPLSSILFHPGSINLSSILATFGAALLIGGIFANKRERIKNEKINVAKTATHSTAH